MAHIGSSLQSLTSEFVSLAASHCGPFLNDISECNARRLLQRGEQATSSFEVRQCPLNRKPRNTRPNYHRAADKWFLKKFGVRYRSNSVFCTSDSDTAESYGHPRVITPIGDYRICWSPTVYDMYFLTTSGVLVDDFIQELENAHYREGDLQEALDSDCEIMLHCEGYVSTALPLTDLAPS